MRSKIRRGASQRTSPTRFSSEIGHSRPTSLREAIGYARASARLTAFGGPLTGVIRRVKQRRERRRAHPLAGRLLQLSEVHAAAPVQSVISSVQRASMAR